MPKWGQNSKKIEAKEREQQKKQEEKQAKAKQAEQEKWKETDPKILKKQAKLQEEEAKRQEKKAKLQEKKEAYEEELQKIQASKKAKPDHKDIKILKADVDKVKQKEKEQLQEKYAPGSKIKKMRSESVDSNDIDAQLDAEFQAFYKPRANYEADVTVAENLDQAFDALTVNKQDKHPEKRVKAAWNNFVNNHMDEFRKEYPSLKRKQIIHFMWKDFAKSPENPMNRPENFDWSKDKGPKDLEK